MGMVQNKWPVCVGSNSSGALHSYHCFLHLEEYFIFGDLCVFLQAEAYYNYEEVIDSDEDLDLPSMDGETES